MSSSNLMGIKQWGNTQVRYLANEFSEKDVQKAIDQVKPDFSAPKDVFVAVTSREVDHIMAAVTDQPKPKLFARKRDSLDDSALLSDLLTQVQSFLKTKFPQFG
jgi:hypothetical protein